MNDGNRFLSLIFALLAIGLMVVGSGVRSRSSRTTREPHPLVGRTIEAVRESAAEENALIRSAREKGEADSRRAHTERSVKEQFGSLPPTRPFREIVVSLLKGPLPPVSGEEGEPWHAVFDTEGRFAATARLRALRPGVPPWIGTKEGAKALHLVVPEAEKGAPVRGGQLLEVLDILCRMMELSHEKVVFGRSSGAASDPRLPGSDSLDALEREFRK